MALLRFFTRVCCYPDHTRHDLFVRGPAVLRALSNSSLPGLDVEFRSLGDRSVRIGIGNLVRAADAITACRSANSNLGACSPYVRSGSASQIVRGHHAVRIYRLKRCPLFRIWRFRLQEYGGSNAGSCDAVELLGDAR